MFRIIFKILGNGKKLPILIYHQILPERDFMRSFEPTADEFEGQMAAIKRHMTPVSLKEGIGGLQDGSLPKDAIAVTFDDGYENNYTVALPILQKHQIPATFFIASDFIDGGIMWNDMVLETIRLLEPGTYNFDDSNLPSFRITDDNSRFTEAVNMLTKLKHLPFQERKQAVERLAQELSRINKILPGNIMMTSSQLRALSDADGMEIGGHTLSHPILTRVSMEEAERQISHNKSVLEEITGKTLESFAYPNGKPDTDYDRSVRDLVQKAGYKIAVTTSHGVAQAGENPFEHPRYTPWRRRPPGFIIQLMQNYFNRTSHLVG
ncbi:MAG: hypothetical protein CSB48_05580 [Proteobacteria bacterium]|nr:MAG: hypothetical protein CSB48_05580 [Pseudomonadota bacterium]